VQVWGRRAHIAVGSRPPGRDRRTRGLGSARAVPPRGGRPTRSGIT